MYYGLSAAYLEFVAVASPRRIEEYVAHVLNTFAVCPQDMARYIEYWKTTGAKMAIIIVFNVVCKLGLCLKSQLLPKWPWKSVLKDKNHHNHMRDLVAILISRFASGIAL